MKSRREVMLPGGCMILDRDGGGGRNAISSGIRHCFGYDPASLSMMLLTDGRTFDADMGCAGESGAEVATAPDPDSRRIMIRVIGDELGKRMEGSCRHDPLVVVMTDPCKVSDDADGTTWDTVRRIAHDGPRCGISLLCLAEGGDADAVRSILTTPLGDGFCVVHGVHADDARRVRI